MTNLSKDNMNLKDQLAASKTQPPVAAVTAVMDEQKMEQIKTPLQASIKFLEKKLLETEEQLHAKNVEIDALNKRILELENKKR